MFLVQEFAIDTAFQGFAFIVKYCPVAYTVDSRYLDFGYLELPLISKRKSGPSLNVEI